MTTYDEADIVLSGIAGSQAYGLATEASDTDMLGVFIAPLTKVLGLEGRAAVDETFTHDSPDYQYHEIGKFCRLALGMNPTVIELLWLDDELYRFIDEAGALLVAMRDKFLSNRAVASYGGYAVQQARKIAGDNVTTNPGKRARHALRLVIQAEHLLTHGDVLVRLDEEQIRACWDADARAFTDPQALALEISERAKALEGIDSVLPNQPDLAYVEKELVKIRMRRAKVETWR